MTTDTPDYERYAHSWSNGSSTKLAVGFAYDEQTVNRFKSLDWSDTHCEYEPDYQFHVSDREAAWTVDIDPATIAEVRERTSLAVPDPAECPINRRPFPDGDSRIAVHSMSPDALSRECSHCGDDGMLSARDFRGVYKNATGLRTELLLDDGADPTHYCESCERLFVVPADERSAMARAMGASAPDTNGGRVR